MRLQASDLPTRRAESKVVASGFTSARSCRGCGQREPEITVEVSLVEVAELEGEVRKVDEVAGFEALHRFVKSVALDDPFRTLRRHIRETDVGARRETPAASATDSARLRSRLSRILTTMIRACSALREGAGKRSRRKVSARATMGKCHDCTPARPLQEVATRTSKSGLDREDFIREIGNGTSPKWAETTGKKLDPEDTASAFERAHEACGRNASESRATFFDDQVNRRMRQRFTRDRRTSAEVPCDCPKVFDEGFQRRGRKIPTRGRIFAKLGRIDHAARNPFNRSCHRGSNSPAFLHYALLQAKE